MFFRRCISITGTVAGALGGLEAGFRIGESFIGLVDAATPLGMQLLGVAAVLLPLIPGAIISRRLLNKYMDEPIKAISSQLLLGVSLGIFCKFVNAAILSIFVAGAVNPITLPFMLSVGASVLCLMGLYWISRPKDQVPAASAMNDPVNPEPMQELVPEMSADGQLSFWSPAPVERFTPFQGRGYRLSEFNS